MLTVKVIVLILSIFVNCGISAPPRPHVIFILSDDQGYRDIGYHGSIFSTDVMDALAQEGVKLENYYVQPLCTPTRSQLLTGRYQIRTGLQHGVLKQSQPSCLPLNETTIAEKMKEAGYSTHIIGKWHLGFYEDECMPTARGFDTFLGYLTGSEDHYTHYKSSGYDFRRNASVEWDYAGVYSTILYAQEAVDLITGHDPDEPMFLYLPFQAPHDPLQVPDSYTSPYSSSINDADRLLYAGMISCMDEAIGNITDALKANSDMYDNTVIIFSSDNGGATGAGGYNWPLRGAKGSYFEGGIKAIGFVHSPLLDSSVKGTINNELMHVSDWFPTIIEGIAGWNTIGTQIPLDGVNQWNTINFGSPSGRREILYNIDPLSVQKKGGKKWARNVNVTFDVKINAAIRCGDMKLITGDKGTDGWEAPPDTGLSSQTGPAFTGQIVWLFNITDDPYEQNDLANTEVAIVIDLLDKLQAYYDEAVDVFFPPLNSTAANPRLNGNGGVWGPWA